MNKILNFVWIYCFTIGHSFTAERCEFNEVHLLELLAVQLPPILGNYCGLHEKKKVATAGKNLRLLPDDPGIFETSIGHTKPVNPDTETALKNGFRPRPHGSGQKIYGFITVLIRENRT